MEHMNEVRTLLLKEVEGLSEAMANAKLSEETWSIVQVLQHLQLLEQAITAKMLDAVEEQTMGTPKEIAFKQLLNRSFKVQAPQYTVPTEVYYALSNVLTHLKETRVRFLEVVQSLTDKQLDTITMDHQRFGTLTLRSWVSLIGYHEQRHVAQIQEIKEQLYIK